MLNCKFIFTAMAFQMSLIFYTFKKAVCFDFKEECLKPRCVLAVTVVGNCPEFYF